jgi:hypothetical protein
MDLEVVRWKTADELLPEEKDFLKENADKLDDGEKIAFQSFLQEEPATEDPVAEVATPETPNEPTPEIPPTAPVTFASEAERDAWLASEIAKRESSKQPESPKEDVKVDPVESLKGKQYVDATEAYKDFKRVEAEQQELQRKEQEKINEQFEAEYKQLAVTKKLPDPTTEEGKQFRLNLVEFGKKHAKQNYTETLELWEQVPEQFGGGFKVADQKKEEDKDKEQINKQKEAAALLNNPAPADPKNQPKPIPYSTLHNTDIDTLIDM